MRVLFVVSTFYPRWGGAENQVRRQAAALAQRGHVVTVITWRYDKSWPRSEVLGGVHVHRVDRMDQTVGGRVRSLLVMSGTVLWHARLATVIVVHHLLATAYLAAWVAWLTHRPLVAKAAATAGGRDSDLRLLRRDEQGSALRRWLSFPLRRHGIAVAMTDEIARDETAAGFVRIVRIPNGVIDRGVADRDRLRAELYKPVDLPTSMRYVAASGRFVEAKGFDTLLMAWSYVVVERPDVRLLLVGSGHDEDRLRRITSDLRIDHSVRFVPSSEKAADYLAAADVVVIPSPYEGMSNVMLEAMASGVPVVATRISGAVDLIVDKESGRLVAPGDVEGLSTALGEVLDHPGDLGARGRDAVLRACDMEHVVDLYEKLFANARTIPPGVVTAAELEQRPLGARTGVQQCVESVG